ncbi:MAG: site-2 protease family protein [Mycobacteriales bacterium]
MTSFGVVAFVVALLLSVMLHEAGHFVTARRFGMKATQFFVGFGPTLWSRRKGETEYGVKAIPAGGFVKIVGMTPLEEVEPGDEDRAFYQQPAGRKAVVLAAGSTVHFLITIVLVFGTIATLGLPDPEAPVLLKPQHCLATTITSDTKTVPGDHVTSGACPAGSVPGVAEAAGFRAGDRVLSVDGTKVKTYTDFQKLIRAAAGKQVATVVERDGARRTLTFTPVQGTRPDLVDASKTVQVGVIGIGGDQQTLRHVGPLAAVPETGRAIGALVTGTVDSLTKKLGTITSVYGPHRDPGGLVGVVGVSRVSGEVFNAPVPFTTRLADFLLIVAGLNLFVGVFNLLPLLPLDGGHLAVVAFESARDRIRRARGYVGEVKRVDYNRLMPVTFAVVVLFAGFSLWLLGADIVNPIRISQ